MRTTACALGLLLLLSGVAVADRQVSGRIDFSPLGTLHTAEGDLNDMRQDTDTAYGIAAAVEFGIAQNFSIGFAPRYLFHVKGETHRDAGKELDLGLRLKGRHALSPKTTLFGMVTPGYSIIYVPNTSIFSGLDPAGLILGIGGGVDFMVSPSVFLTIELGYTFGFQDESEGGVNYQYETDLLHLGFGLGTKF